MTGGDARAQTVVRALTLLERFSAEEPEHTATELSVATGLTVPTTHRLLKTLASKSFLVLDPESKKYSLGPAVVQLAGAVLGRDNLLELVDPVLIELRRASGETASLHWLVDNERVCIAERASHQSIRMSSGLDRRYTLHAGAAGKVLLASLPPAEMKSYLDRGYSANTIHTARIELEEDLAAIRAKRYALSQGEVVRAQPQSLHRSGIPPDTRSPPSMSRARAIAGLERRWSHSRCSSSLQSRQSSTRAATPTMSNAQCGGRCFLIDGWSSPAGMTDE